MNTSPATPPPGYSAAAKTSGMAITALVLGILGFLTSCVGIGLLLAVLAIILGAVAMVQINKPDSRQTGHGLALTGTILGGATIVLIPVIALLVGIMLPALSAARNTARRMQNSTQVRGIQQGFVMYAQGNGNHFPGLDSAGEPVDLTVEGRYRILLDANYFTADYAISPSEYGKQPWTGGAVTPTNYSYAMSDIGEPGGRRDAWRDLLSEFTVDIADRNTGTVANPASIHDSAWWKGSIGYNDNSVEFEVDPQVVTEYGSQSNPNDDLFDSQGTFDALMIDQGQ